MTAGNTSVLAGYVVKDYGNLIQKSKRLTLVVQTTSTFVLMPAAI